MTAYTGVRPRPQGFVYTRRRPGTELLSERLARRLAEEYKRRVDALVRQFTDNGRAAGQLRLTRTEQLARLWEATPQDWSLWAAQAQAIVNERERNQAQGQLFAEWANVQKGKALGMPFEVWVASQGQAQQMGGQALGNSVAP